MRRIALDRRVEQGGIEVHVVVEHTPVALGPPDVLLFEHATVSAAHAGCGALELEAAAGSYFVALGRQDALTGHAGFDDRYIVKTNDEAAMRYWFGEREADAVLATYDATTLDPFALHVDPTEVRLVARWTHEAYAGTGDTFAGILRGGPRPRTLITRLDEAVAAVAMLAGRGGRLAAEWRARLEPLGVVDAGPVWRTGGRYGLTLERGRTRVRVDFPWQLPPLRHGGLRTRLSIAWPDPGAANVWPRSWSWRRRPRLDRGRELALPRPWSGEVRDAPALAALPDLAPALTALGADWLLAADGTLALGWDRIVDDRERLAAAVGQLERWSERVAPSSGPYR